jgi:hypothetical protein
MEANAMTNDEIIEMANKAKLPYDYVTGELMWLDKLEQFAKLVAEKALETKDEFVAWEQFYPDIGKPQIAFNAEVVGYVAPQRTWVGLTKEEIDQNLLRSPYALQTASAWRDGVAWAMQQLKDKNA